ncbi:MAG: LamB/YcsF family protein [Verrucomicrobiae bacterium]|nr:LamB/YcsF family protein [Verrucomicrobiae bacterium]
MSMPTPALGCDLGEGEDPALTARLMARLDAVHIACGGHAGDMASMAVCLELARAHGVRVGAHPGWPDPKGFGRHPALAPDPAIWPALLRDQVRALQSLTQGAGVRLHHVKLHGAWYHATDSDDALAVAHVRAVADLDPGLVIVARAGGRVAAMARAQGQPVWEEAFLDRGYCDDGTLVPRDEPGALLEDPALAVRRLRELLARGGWPGRGGAWIPLRARILCVHADSPGALALLEAAREELRRSRTPRPSGTPV